MIYFDNAATSWQKPEPVYAAVNHTMRNSGNAGRGGNSMSIDASRILYSARYGLSNLFGVDTPERIVFTQNVTEALNLAIKGVLNRGDHVIISPFEHNSVVRVLEFLKVEWGVTYSVASWDVLNESIDARDIAEAFAKEIRPETKLICTTHASNVFGTILPIAEIGRTASEHGIRFLVDVAQTAGVLPIDVKSMHIDLLAFTGHKGIMGPQGTGGLYVAPDIKIRPLLHGGTGSLSARLEQPDMFPEALESGTRNIPGIAGLLAGVEFCMEHVESIRAHELALLDTLLQFLVGKQQVTILGPTDVRQRVGLVTFTVQSKRADEIGVLLERNYGIITRTGLHCSPLAHQAGGTLEQGGVRISVGYYNTRDEIHRLIDALEEVVC